MENAISIIYCGIVREIVSILVDEDGDGQYLSGEEAAEFVEQHDGPIKECVRRMYDDYVVDGELEDLAEAELDWFREYISDGIYAGIRLARQIGVGIS